MLYNEEQKAKFKIAVQLLKEIDIDGESTQHLLEEICMEDQMLKQLILSRPLDEIANFVEDRMEFERSTDLGGLFESAMRSMEKGLTRDQLIRRLYFVSEDLHDIETLLRELDVDTSIEGSAGCGLITYLTNLEILSDIDANGVPKDDVVEREWNSEGYKKFSEGQ